jgi:hypothetical protein
MGSLPPMPRTKMKIFQLGIFGMTGVGKTSLLYRVKVPPSVKSLLEVLFGTISRRLTILAVMIVIESRKRWTAKR